jgi:CRP-like cAMP-binding protein
MPASLHPLFAALTPVETERALALAARREAAAGEAVVEQWDLSRDFFVIVSGTVEVRVDGEPVNALGPGDFFGELAALDWGAGFGYPRLASVVATAPLRLLVYRDGTLNRLVAELPGLAGVIRTAVAERLARR